MMFSLSDATSQLVPLVSSHWLDPWWMLPASWVSLLIAARQLFPVSGTASKAAWAALVIGIALAVVPLVTSNRLALVLTVPLITLAAPLAVWRRSRSQSGSILQPVAMRALILMVIGNLLLLFGMNGSVRAPEAGWPLFVWSMGSLCLCGLLPFHRPLTELVRHTPPELRAPVSLLLGPVTWLAVAATVMPGLSLELQLDSGWMTWPAMTTWLSALLVLGRGDLGRLCAATWLFAAGRSGTALFGLGDTGWAFSGGLIAQTGPLVLIILLLSRLERMAGTPELSELGGMVHRIPRFCTALVIAALLLCGGATWGVLGWLLPSSLHWSASGAAPVGVWKALPLLLPQIVVVWGWVRILTALLAGESRTPVVPHPLRDRMDVPPADRPFNDLTGQESILIGITLLLSLVAAFF